MTDTTGFSLKDILQNPVACCAARWPAADEAARQLTQVQALIDELETLRPLLREKKTAKQLCSRDFGRIKAEGGDLAAAKASMQVLGNELADIEAKQQAVEAALLNLFAAATVDAPRLPQRFATFIRAGNDAVQIAPVDADDSPAIAAWSDYAAAHPQASLYHDYRWREVIRRSFGHESLYLMARSGDGAVRGVLPLIRLRSRLFGDFAVSVPYFNYGGPLADTPDIARKLLNTAAEWAHANAVGHLEIRATSPLNEWPARTDKASMIRPLPASVAELDRELGAKVRAQINRARQTEAQARIGNIELLDDFYRVFAINMRDLGTPVYSKNFFRIILETFAGQAHLVVVYLNGRAVSAAFLLGHGEMMEIPWASTLRSVNALNMNMLLYHEVLSFCIAQGYAFFDFGRSTKDAGTYRFKKQWGAEPVQHHWHYWLPGGGELPALKPDSPKFRLAIAVWQRLPVALTRLIGPPIVKFLP
jgi:FemAB-related protein (PEP-CTERM system-associated)